MRLADFILNEMEAILVQWEAFARIQLPASEDMSALALRDHARQILEAVAKDLFMPQGREAQRAKSLGQAPKLISAPETAAETHALLRAKSGFSINQLVAEYRALRASVLRLWMDACKFESPHVDDIIRFNEAIDQAIAESINFFSIQVEQSRDLFLGMLGHDLRTPLQAIQMTAAYLAALNAGSPVTEAAARVINSGSQMTSLLNDLVDFNRSKLGLGIRLAPAKVDVATLFAEELAQLRTVHPDQRIELTLDGDTSGSWDGPRLQQMLGNLVINAIKYGTAGETVHVDVRGDDGALHFKVRNSGVSLDPSTLDQIFEPLNRGARGKDGSNSDASLGLGLYIAREIAKGHGGTIEARLEAGQTVFAVRLPRRA
jgi:signal transduction histidine kinase